MPPDPIPQSPTPDDPDDSWLAFWHERLAAGASLEGLLSEAPPELRPHLARNAACLQLLGDLWPAPTAADTAVAPASATADALPRDFGRFRLKSILGQGGFGFVYLAEDPTLGREVALKVPRLGALLTAELRQNFHREALAAARLDHPNIVPVYEAGEIGPISYIASAYCPGITLAEWLKQETQPVPWPAAADLVATLADAVHHAHTRGVLHRDLKPGNVLLTGGELVGLRGGEKESSAPPPPHGVTTSPPHNLATPKITDFGLAQLLSQAEGGPVRDGMIAGTAPYMAPEQTKPQAKDISTATDVYALGAILYELLTGRPPFRGDTSRATLQMIRTDPPIPPRQRRREVSRDVEAICLKCLEKEPGRRYGSAAELAADLRRARAGEPTQARPIGIFERMVKWVRRRPAIAGLFAAAVLVLLGLVVGATLLLRHRAEMNRLHQLTRAWLQEFFTEDANARNYPMVRPGSTPDQLLTDVQQLYAALESAPANSGDAELRVETAQVLRFVGDFYARRQDWSTAEAAYRKAIARQEGLVRESPDQPRYRVELAETFLRLGHVAASGREQERDRLRSLEQGAGLFEQLAAQFPRDPRYRTRLAAIHRYLAERLSAGPDRLDDAEILRHIDRALTVAGSLVAEFPDDPNYAAQLRSLYQDLAAYFQRTRRHPAAAWANQHARALAARDMATAATGGLARLDLKRAPPLPGAEPLVLVCLGPVRDLLGVKPEEYALLDRCADEWRQAESDLYRAAPDYQTGAAPATDAWEQWHRGLRDRKQSFESRLMTVLGAARCARLGEIRHQLLGVSTLAEGGALTRDFGVSREQLRVFESIVNEVNRPLYQALATHAALGSLTELPSDAAASMVQHHRGRYRANHAEVCRRIHALLTPAQKERWARLTGEPLDPTVLRAIYDALAEWQDEAQRTRVAPLETAMPER